MTEHRRFQAFTEGELVELWEGLVYDDGIRYEPEESTIERQLVEEIVAEWAERVPHGWWGATLEDARRRRDELLAELEP